MSESDRRKFLRVLFEANFEVRSSEWTDKEATGLDISLNGCRFNCKQSISDGEILKARSFSLSTLRTIFLLIYGKKMKIWMMVVKLVVYLVHQDLILKVKVK